MTFGVEKMRLNTIIIYGIIYGLLIGVLSMTEGDEEQTPSMTQKEVVYYQPTMESYTESEEYVVPVVTSDPFSNYIFDYDKEIGTFIYKRNSCVVWITGGKSNEEGSCEERDHTNLRLEMSKFFSHDSYDSYDSYVTTPRPTPTNNPVAMSTPISVTNKPFENPWDFIEYVQNNWNYIADPDGKLVQDPSISFKLLSGDCDDFAAMIAYYLQEVYGYDTVIVIVDNSWRDGLHAVSFVHADQNTINSLAQNCGTDLPIITINDNKYIAIDWEICPDWIFTGSGRITTYEWDEVVGKVW